MSSNTENMVLSLPQPFGFYRFILGGDHLHFGLWPEGQEGLPIEDAQQHMFERLASFLPPSPATLLDVGCGLGYSAFLLAQKGYKVTAIAPSGELINYAISTYGESGVVFKTMGFFDADASLFINEYYDVILFQESTQYLHPLSDVMKKAHSLLKEKGLIIIGDEVCYDRSIKQETAVHLSSDFKTALAENGFAVTEYQRIGKNVMKTCDYVINGFMKHHDALSKISKRHDIREGFNHYLNGWEKQKQWYTKGQMGYEMFVARKDDFSIRPYDQGDESEILPMFNEIFKVNRTMDHWHWKFSKNPYGSHKISKAVSGDDEMVVHYAGYPSPFCYFGDKRVDFLSYQIGDTMTKPSVRSIGLGKTGLLARTAHHFYAKFCEGQVPFIYGFNTGKIRKLGMRYLEYTYIDPVTYWLRDVKTNLMKPSTFFQKFLTRFSIEEVTTTDMEWDDFFDHVGPSYKFLIRRDASYVRWRYIGCPDKVHRVFAIRKHGKLVGWSVFAKRDQRLMWGDAFFNKRYPEAVSSLLETVVRQYYSGIETIEAWFPCNPEWWKNILEELKFTIIPEPNDIAPGFVIFQDVNWAARLHDSFYYTMGDSDLF